MPTGMIRPMELRDVDAVVALDKLCIPTPWSPDTFTRELSGEFNAYYVLELAGRLVAYLGGQMIFDEAHIFTLGVHPDYRREGRGEKLLLHFLRQAGPYGVVRVTLEVRESNTAASRLYEKWGFRPVGRRRRYYPDNQEDAIVMWIEDLRSTNLQNGSRGAADACPGD